MTHENACSNCQCTCSTECNVNYIQTSCAACPTNSNSPMLSSGQSACKCNAGYTGPDDGVCTTCVAGKFKNVTGNSSCIDCPAGAYSGVVGATNASVCVTCAAGQYWSGASACTACGENNCFCENYGNVGVEMENVQRRCGTNQNEACTASIMSPSTSSRPPSNSIDGDQYTYVSIENSVNAIPAYLRIDLGVPRWIAGVKTGQYSINGNALVFEVGNVNAISTSSSFPNKFCSFVVSGYQDINKNCTVQCSGLSWSSTPFSACTNANRLGTPTFIQGQFVFIRGVDLGYVSNSATYLNLYEISITAVQMSCVACPANSGSPFSSTSKMISSCIRIIPESTMRQ